MTDDEIRALVKTAMEKSAIESVNKDLIEASVRTRLGSWAKLFGAANFLALAGLIGGVVAWVSITVPDLAAKHAADKSKALTDEYSGLRSMAQKALADALSDLGKVQGNVGALQAGMKNASEQLEHLKDDLSNAGAQLKSQAAQSNDDLTQLKSQEAELMKTTEQLRNQATQLEDGLKVRTKQLESQAGQLEADLKKVTESTTAPKVRAAADLLKAIEADEKAATVLARMSTFDEWKTKIDKAVRFSEDGIEVTVVKTRRLTVLDGDGLDRGGFSTNSGSVTLALRSPGAQNAAELTVDRDANSTFNLHGTKGGTHERFEVIPSSPWFARRILDNGAARDVVFTK